MERLQTLVALTMCAAAAAGCQDDAPPGSKQPPPCDPSLATVPRYAVQEYMLSHPTGDLTNPWEQVAVTATLSAPSRQFTVGGFYYAPDTYKVRVAPDELGPWSFSIAVAGSEVQSGAFCVVDGGEPGFLAKNPANPYRLVYSNGAPYFPFGINDCTGDHGNGNPFAAMAIDEMHPVVDLDTYLATYGAAGFNLYRFPMSNAQNCEFLVYHDASSLSPSGNVYLERESRWADELLQKLRANGFRVLLTIFPKDVPLRDNPADAAGMEALKRYARYVVDRYGVYVDFWELMNEQHAADDWKQQIADAIRERDPYHHLISTSWPDLPHPAIDINAPHWYYTEDELDADAAIADRIFLIKRYDLPVIVGEQGESDVNWSPTSAVRMRIRQWAALFSEGSIVFWNTSFKKSYHGSDTGNGGSNLYIGPEERGYEKALTDFATGLTAGVKMMAITPPAPLRAYGLVDGPRLWLYVVNASDHQNPTTDLAVPVPAGTHGNVRFVSPADGSVLGTATVDHGGGMLPLPAFVTDLAVEIKP
jgi:hypothetical protein